MADELNSAELELGCAWRSTEACLRASRTLSTRGACTCTDGSSIHATPFLLIVHGVMRNERNDQPVCATKESSFCLNCQTRV